MRSRPEHMGMKLIDLSDNTSIAAAGDNTQTLTPPKGQCYQIVNMFYNAPDPPGSAAGTHRIEIHCMGLSTGAEEQAVVDGTTGTSIIINKWAAWFGDSTEQPSNIAQQLWLTQGNLWASNSSPITFLYTNDTDVAQTGTRTLKILVRVFSNDFD